MIVTLYYDTSTRSGWPDVIVFDDTTNKAYLLSVTNSYSVYNVFKINSVADIWSTREGFNIHSTYKNPEDLLARQPKWYSSIARSAGWTQSKNEI